MLTHNKSLALGTVGLFFAALPVFAKPAQPKATVQTVTIESSGSTNTFGYKVIMTSTGIGRSESVLSSYIDLDYKITMISGGKTSSFSTLSGHGTSPTGKPITTMAQGYGASKRHGMPELQEAAQKFFADLDSAMPLTSLPVRHGMRSASFGTSTCVTYRSQKLPDLTFASDSRVVALKADIAAITKILGVGNSPRRPLVLRLNKPNTN